VLQLRAGSATHVGMVRQNNQDTPLVTDGLWAVADGMGGHRGGEVASAMAVDALQRSFRDVAPDEDGLLDAAASANTAVHDAATDDPDLHGMGTTLVAIARTDDDELALVNIGDSRIYLFRDGELSQLTEDHNLVSELVREGRLTPEEARVHPKRNIVTRALGIDAWVQADSSTIVPYDGDRFVLCSDGLFNEVDESRIAATLRRIDDPTEAANELIRLANEGGGRDNITVVVLDVVDDGGRAERASAAVGAGTASGDGDLAGFATAVDDDGAVVAPAAGAAAGAPRPPEVKGPRRLTWRVAVFALLVVAVLAAGAGALGWYARNTYYVGLGADGAVTIFRGKPDPVLWFDATVEERSDLRIDDLAPEARDDVSRGVEFSDLAGAQAFLARVTTTTTTSTTTTSTTTTVPPTTAPPVTAAPPPP
jgi:protein phosphatase